MEELEQTPEKKGFDMGISTLYRINYWIATSNNFSFDEDVNSYLKALNNVYKEIIPFLREKKDRREYYKTLKAKIRTALEKYNNVMSQDKIIYNPSNELLELLEEFDVELRFDTDKEGLYMKRLPGSDTAML